MTYLAGQRDLFKPPHPLEGLTVKVGPGRGCRKCKTEILVISRIDVGPHAAELACPRCHWNCDWLSKEAVAFVASIVAKFGCPNGPIILRRGGNDGDRQ
jgi:hypothetical protein